MNNMWNGNNYIIDEEVIIMIRDLPKSGISYALVFSYPKTDSFFAVRGDTKEIIKFKSLLKAIEIGWEIKNLNI